MKMKPDIYILIVILLFSLAFGLISFFDPSLKSKLMPFILSCIIFFLTTVQLIREFLAGRRAGIEKAPADENSEEEAQSTLGQNVVIFAWLTGMALAIYLFGFLISIPLFVFSFLKSNGFGWLISAAHAAAAVIVTYVLFILALQSELYPGIIFG
jgi:hypothetical protein